MQLAFLGTGSAYSLERYNGVVVVDRRLLLDGGAPLLPHMHRLGIDPAAIDAVFLTHVHGDHVLGLPPFVLYRAVRPPGFPLVIVSPPGAQEALETLFTLAWGDGWPAYREAACRGYRLQLDGRLLAYAGDTSAGPALDELVRGADVAITEATAPGDGSGVHTTWEEAAQLVARHPDTRFLLNHLYSGQTEH